MRMGEHAGRPGGELIRRRVGWGGLENGFGGKVKYGVEERSAPLSHIVQTEMKR